MKKALLIIGIIIGAFLVITAVMPSEVRVERSLMINAPIDLVFDQVNDLKKNFNWSPWLEKDPEMQVEWGEVTSGLGASYSWTGNDDVGSGTLTIEEVRENEFIQNDIDFGEMGLGKGTWDFEEIYREDDNGAMYAEVKVTWGMQSQLGWPIGRIFGPFMDDWVGADFEKGLSNLKEVSESLPVMPKLEVMEVDYPEMTILSVKDSCAIAEIGPKMGEMMGRLIAAVQGNEDLLRGQPICYYSVWDEERQFTVMEAAIPVDPEMSFKSKDGVEIKVMPGGRAAKVEFVGNYEKLGSAHYAIDEWMNKNSKEMAGAPWEQYISDPGAEPDPEKLITHIYYPIQ